MAVITLVVPATRFLLQGVPGPATQRSIVAAAPSTGAPAPSTGAPTPSTGAPVPTPSYLQGPRISAARWLHGLGLLQRRMNHTQTGTSGIVTVGYLRSQARQLHRCSPELAGLGPPAGRLKRAFRLAAQACGEFEQAANCYAGAARAFDPYSVTAHFTKLLNCGDAGANMGSVLIGEAVVTGTAS